ncbi:MAG: bifunctional 4-hydroxy-2-oxoglutarate aldolase/2-dehydro-3-deoxy-phosphogluconate aldolase [Saprospiraceae bacterium]
MAKLTRLQVFEQIISGGLVPLFYTPDPETAFEIARACYEGGARILEFTNRGDYAHEVFIALSKMVRREMPDLALGVGSVQDAGAASLFIQCGADFVVTPLLREDVIGVCNRRKIAVIPGAATSTEIGRAEELGAEVVKITPGEVLSPAFIKAHLGPCPWTRAMVSGGVRLEESSLRAWFEAGAACVGMGSQLISRQRIALCDWTGLRGDVAQALAWISQIRRESDAPRS